MGRMQNGGYIGVILFSYLSPFTGLFAPCHASDNAFLVFQSSTARNLLQTKKSCPVNFEIQNYTIITSQCKGPEYPPKKCCDALSQFACPFTENINDATTDCATTMFSYIHLYGKYPTGLFASECKGGNNKQGLKCTLSPPSQSADHGGGNLSGRRSNPSPPLATTFLALLLCFI